MMNHRGTEHTEVAQRRAWMPTFRANPVSTVQTLSALRVVAKLQPWAGISQRLPRLRQRLDIEEELERAGLLHSEQELKVNALSRSQRCGQRYCSSTQTAIERSA